MSFGDAAPVSATAPATIARSSSSESSAGRYVAMISASASSASARSACPPSRNAGADSWRRLRSRRGGAAAGDRGGGLGAALAPAAEAGALVPLPLLRVLLQPRQHEPQRADAVLV